MTDGAKLKKAKKYTNIVHHLLLREDKKYILEYVNILGLYLLLGAVEKFLKNIEFFLLKTLCVGYSLSSNICLS